MTGGGSRVTLLESRVAGAADREAVAVGLEARDADHPHLAVDVIDDHIAPVRYEVPLGVEHAVAGADELRHTRGSDLDPLAPVE